MPRKPGVPNFTLPGAAICQAVSREGKKCLAHALSNPNIPLDLCAVHQRRYLHLAGLTDAKIRAAGEQWKRQGTLDLAAETNGK